MSYFQYLTKEQWHIWVGVMVKYIAQYSGCFIQELLLWWCCTSDCSRKRPLFKRPPSPLLMAIPVCNCLTLLFFILYFYIEKKSMCLLKWTAIWSLPRKFCKQNLSKCCLVVTTYYSKGFLNILFLHIWKSLFGRQNIFILWKCNQGALGRKN